MYESPPPRPPSPRTGRILIGYILVLCLVWGGLFGVPWWAFGGSESPPAIAGKRRGPPNIRRAAAS